MDFLKKNYEKVLLGAVLLGLAVAVAFLPFKISSERKSLEDMSQSLTRPKVKELTNLDLTLPQKALQRVSAPVAVNFSEPHKLFNPMPWKKASDGRLIKVDASNIGPGAVTITKMTPLHLELRLDQVTMVDSPRYVIGTIKEADPDPRKRAKRQTYCKINDKNETFALREVQGPPENPTNIVVELNDTGARVSLAKDKPFRRVDGFMASLKYSPENKTWENRRVGDVLNFAGEPYKIVAITKEEVILLAPSGKKTTIKNNATAT
jgi:hypothetical protein